jgi:hypothetical protein
LQITAGGETEPAVLTFTGAGVTVGLMTGGAVDGGVWVPGEFTQAQAHRKRMISMANMMKQGSAFRSIGITLIWHQKGDNFSAIPA